MGYESMKSTLIYIYMLGYTDNDLESVPLGFWISERSRSETSLTSLQCSSY